MNHSNRYTVYSFRFFKCAITLGEITFIECLLYVTVVNFCFTDFFTLKTIQRSRSRLFSTQEDRISENVQSILLAV